MPLDSEHEDQKRKVQGENLPDDDLSVGQPAAEELPERTEEPVARAEEPMARAEEPMARAEEPAQQEQKAFVRRINDRFAAVYSLGGLAILALLALYFGFNVYFLGLDAFAHATLWVGALLLFLVGLFVLRIFVARRARGLLAEVSAYCGGDPLEISALRRTFGHDETFPFFESVFVINERRLQGAQKTLDRPASQSVSSKSASPEEEPNPAASQADETSTTP